MSRSTSNNYQGEVELERAIIDLVRVGVKGHGPGVRQLANRLIRSVPSGVRDSDTFRSSIRGAILAGTSGAELRYSAGDIPTEGDTAQPLVEVNSSPDGNGLILNEKVWRELREIVEERYRVDELARAGVGLTRTVLFSGPPGVGKTMAAQWLARMLELPLLTLDLASVVSSYLGTSGRNIRAVLSYAKSGPCVLLLDEFDAIAKRRDDDSDIGELKRIVNVILVELDKWPDTSLLIGATNHAHLLDLAVERRFDRLINFPLPGVEQRRDLLVHLSQTVPGVDSEVTDMVAESTEGISYSDLTRIWSNAHRRSILAESNVTQTLIEALAQTVSTDASNRDGLFVALKQHLSLSNRQIAQLMGVSHPTVAAGLKRAKGASRGPIKIRNHPDTTTAR